MRRYRWFAAAVLLGAVVLLGAFLVVGNDPAPPPGPPTGVPRVAVSLGDSTISGESAGDYVDGTDGTDGNWCHRSRHAMIHQVTIRGVDETVNLACSGAPSAQVSLGEARQYTEGSQARRLGALARQKRVVAVLVGVGANDDPAFGRVIDDCVQAWFDQGKPGCAQTRGGDWQTKVDAMVPKVHKALDDIREVLRDAGYQPTDYQLVLQSYAAPVSPDALTALRNLNGCPFRDDDLRWVRQSAVPALTEGIRRVARDTGARFLDLSRAGLGREACARNTPTEEWFSRLSVRWTDLQDDDRASHALQESFHPNAAGHTAFGHCLAEFLPTTDRAAACLPGTDGTLHPATSLGP